MCIRDSLPVTLVYHDPVLLPGIVEPLKDPLGALTFIAFRQPPYKLYQLLGRAEILLSSKGLLQGHLECTALSVPAADRLCLLHELVPCLCQWILRTDLLTVH